MQPKTDGKEKGKVGRGGSSVEQKGKSLFDNHQLPHPHILTNAPPFNERWGHCKQGVWPVLRWREENPLGGREALIDRGGRSKTFIKDSKASASSFPPFSPSFIISNPLSTLNTVRVLRLFYAEKSDRESSDFKLEAQFNNLFPPQTSFRVLGSRTQPCFGASPWCCSRSKHEKRATNHHHGQVVILPLLCMRQPCYRASKRQTFPQVDLVSGRRELPPVDHLQLGQQTTLPGAREFWFRMN